MSSSHFIFKEYQLISRDDFKDNIRAFDDLKKFASYEENYRYIDIARGGNFLRLKNFVGTITTNNETTIEILPKIYGLENNEFESKRILFNMIKTLKDVPFKKTNKSLLSTSNLTIFEVYISMFVEELAELIKKGIKSDYITKEENLFYLKGKLNLSKHLKRNLLNREKFFVQFDEYSSNRIENRLIKTTLLFLYKISKSLNNKQRIREFIFTFEEVKVSKNPKDDFKKCRFDRTMKDYEQIIQWCKIFLDNHSFCSYRGDSIAYALLFDMNVLFESFVAYHFKKSYKGSKVKTQDRKYKLLENPSLFQLKPDIVIDNKIYDTKWKIINSKKKNLDISQSDLYQMYAYGKKYSSSDIYLIYPKSENFLHSIEKPYKYDESLNLHILCFDCEKNEISNI